MIDRLYQIHLVYNEETKPIIKKLRNKISLKPGHSEAKAGYTAVEVWGASLRDVGITKIKRGKKDIDINDGYRYNLYIFRSQEDMDKFDKSRIAYRIVKKWERLTDTPVEPYEEEIHRPSDMFLWDDIDNHKDYGPCKWIEIDMNSAEPYYVSKFIPFLKPDIDNLYKSRKTKPLNKLALNSINGHLRNRHPSIYLKVVNTLYEEMFIKAAELEQAGAKIFALRRDALLFMAPDDFKIPDSIKIGKEIGEFKVKEDYGTITTGNGSSYFTDMDNIDSKHSGVIKPSALNLEVKLIANKHLQIGLLIEKRRKHEK